MTCISELYVHADNMYILFSYDIYEMYRSNIISHTPKASRNKHDYVQDEFYEKNIYIYAMGVALITP